MGDHQEAGRVVRHAIRSIRIIMVGSISQTQPVIYPNEKPTPGDYFDVAEMKQQELKPACLPTFPVGIKVVRDFGGRA